MGEGEGRLDMVPGKATTDGRPRRCENSDDRRPMDDGTVEALVRPALSGGDGASRMNVVEMVGADLGPGVMHADS